MSSAADDFRRTGYVLLPGLIDDALLKVIEYHLSAELTHGGLFDLDDLQAHRLCRYRDPVADAVLHTVCPRLEELLEISLSPTYSLIAVYFPGSDLSPHQDRDASEIAVSVAVATRTVDGPGEPWGLWLKTADGDREVILSPGDGLLYRGCDISHYRRPSTSWSISMLLFYVDRTGPRRHHEEDRPALERAAAPATSSPDWVAALASRWQDSTSRPASAAPEVSADARWLEEPFVLEPTTRFRWDAASRFLADRAPGGYETVCPPELLPLVAAFRSPMAPKQAIAQFMDGFEHDDETDPAFEADLVAFLGRMRQRGLLLPLQLTPLPPVKSE